MESFWAELKRRNVYRVGVAYAVVGWMLAQVATVFVPALNLPAWLVSAVVLVVVIGFPVANTSVNANRSDIFQPH